MKKRYRVSGSEQVNLLPPFANKERRFSPSDFRGNVRLNISLAIFWAKRYRAQMRYGTQILVETTKSQKEALTSVLKENGATLTEWFTDHIAEATADFSLEPIHTPPDLRSLNDIENSKSVSRS